MTIEEAAQAIDDYAGSIDQVEPVGTVAVPIRLLVALRRALRGEA